MCTSAYIYFFGLLFVLVRFVHFFPLFRLLLLLLSLLISLPYVSLRNENQNSKTTFDSEVIFLEIFVVHSLFFLRSG